MNAYEEAWMLSISIHLDNGEIQIVDSLIDDAQGEAPEALVGDMSASYFDASRALNSHQEWRHGEEDTIRGVCDWVAQYRPTDPRARVAESIAERIRREVEANRRRVGNRTTDRHHAWVTEYGIRRNRGPHTPFEVIDKRSRPNQVWVREIRSRVIHAYYAQLLATDESIIASARVELECRRRDGSIPEAVHDDWLVILERPAGEVAKMIVLDSERMIELRHHSPFTRLRVVPDEVRLALIAAFPDADSLLPPPRKWVSEAQLREVHQRVDATHRALSDWDSGQLDTLHAILRDTRLSDYLIAACQHVGLIAPPLEARRIVRAAQDALDATPHLIRNGAQTRMDDGSTWPREQLARSLRILLMNAEMTAEEALRVGMFTR